MHERERQEGVHYGMLNSSTARLGTCLSESYACVVIMRAPSFSLTYLF
jgi:hypothetical protein